MIRNGRLGVPTLGIKGRVTTKENAQIANEIDQIGTRVDPILQIRDRNKTRRVNVRVGALDDHVPGGVNVDARRVARVRLHEPDEGGDVVGDALKRHGDGAVSLEEVDGTAVVVGEGGGFGFEGREGGGEGNEVLADEPLGVLGVREGGGAALGENRAQELLGQLRVRRLHRRWDHRGGSGGGGGRVWIGLGWRY